MSRKRNRWDNAVATSLMGTLEQDLGGLGRWTNVTHARAEVGRWIHAFDNDTRLHSTFGLHGPVEYDALHRASITEDAWRQMVGHEGSGSISLTQPWRRGTTGQTFIQEFLMQTFRLFASVGVLALLSACEGPEGKSGTPGAEGGAGQDGANGQDGAAGQDGADGEDGANGQDGATGNDASCYGRDALSITGFDTEVPALTVNYPSAALTVQHNSSFPVSWTVVGSGVAYAWTGDSVIMTAMSDELTNQVLIGTDGCTTAMYSFDVEAEYVYGYVQLADLFDGSSYVEAYEGDEYLMYANFGAGSNYSEMVASPEPRSVTIYVDGSEAATVELTVDNFETTQTAQTVIVHGNGGVADTYVMQDQVFASASDVFAVSAVHLADGVGTVDVWETVSGTALVSDLAFDSMSAYAEVPAATYWLGIDADDDGAADFEFSPLDLTEYGGYAGSVVAYTSGGAPQLWVNSPAAGNYNLSPIYTVTTTPYNIVDLGYGPLAISDLTTTTETSYLSCGTLLDLTVNLDITHSFRGDLVVSLTNPGGTSVMLHNSTGGGADDLTGTYNLDGTGSLTSVDSLSAFLGGASDGDWTLSVYDDAEEDVGTLNNFSLTATCY